jgi:hypothetical protein
MEKLQMTGAAKEVTGPVDKRGTIVPRTTAARRDQRATVCLIDE